MDNAIQVRRPWNKGLIVDRSDHCCRDRHGRSAFGLRCPRRQETSRCSTLRSTANCERRTWFALGSRTSARDRSFATEGSSQLKTGRPVQFEIAEMTRQSVERLPKNGSSSGSDYLLRSRTRGLRTYLPASMLASSMLRGTKGSVSRQKVDSGPSHGKMVRAACLGRRFPDQLSGGE